MCTCKQILCLNVQWRLGNILSSPEFFILFHALMNQKGKLSIDWATVTSWLLNNGRFPGSSSTGGNKVLYPVLSWRQWSWRFILTITFISLFLLWPLQNKTKRKKKPAPPSVSMDMYAWQQLPGATKAKNNSILEQRLEKKSFTRTFAVLLNESLLSGWQLFLMKCSSSHLHNDLNTTKWITVMRWINHN